MALLSAIAESSDRLVDANNFLQRLTDLDGPEELMRIEQRNIDKGLYFVVLYAALEFAMTKLVTEAISEICSASICYSHFSPALYSIMLEPEFSAIRDASGKRKWETRHKFLNLMNSSDNPVFDMSALNRDLQNIWPKTIEVVFQAFGITESHLHDVRAKQYLNELVENRNAISHGRERPSEIGKRYSFTDLQLRQTQIATQVGYLFEIFEQYLHSKSYIRSDMIDNYT